MLVSLSPVPVPVDLPDVDRAAYRRDFESGFAAGLAERAALQPSRLGSHRNMLEALEARGWPTTSGDAAFKAGRLTAYRWPVALVELPEGFDINTATGARVEFYLGTVYANADGTYHTDTDPHRRRDLGDALAVVARRQWSLVAGWLNAAPPAPIAA